MWCHKAWLPTFQKSILYLRLWIRRQNICLKHRYRTGLHDKTFHMSRVLTFSWFLWLDAAGFGFVVAFIGLIALLLILNSYALLFTVARAKFPEFSFTSRYLVTDPNHIAAHIVTGWRLSCLTHGSKHVHSWATTNWKQRVRLLLWT
jgi:hypothetical protein